MVEDFNEPVGAAVSVPNTVKGLFRLIFDRVLIDHIVEETNRYARTVMGESRYEKWEKIKADDIYTYFGIMIMMGLVELQSLHDYWQRDPLFNCPAITERRPGTSSWRYISISILWTTVASFHQVTQGMTAFVRYEGF